MSRFRCNVGCTMKLLCGVALVAITTLMSIHRDPPPETTRVGALKFFHDTLTFELKTPQYPYLEWGPRELPRGQLTITKCEEEMDLAGYAYQENFNSQCFHIGRKAELKIRAQEFETTYTTGECTTIELKSTSCEYIPENCIKMGHGHWYGGGELFMQKWPSSQQMAIMQPYLATDMLGHENIDKGGMFGSVLERLWVTSRGVGIHVENDVALHVSMNANGDGLFCLRGDDSSPAYRWGEETKADVPSRLTYTVCHTDTHNVKDILRYMYDKHYNYPAGVPDERVFKKPIWSTWARYKAKVTQDDVIAYANEIHGRGFPSSQIEIDDRWSTTYGDFEFDPVKFPDPEGMMTQLKRKGFRVTVWVTPFANLDSKAFQEGTEKDYWVKLKVARGYAPALVKWWQGVGAVLDVTNPEAVEWYVGRLQRLQQATGIHSFKFDAGEVRSFLPEGSVTKQPLENPGDWTTEYAKIIARFGGAVEMRAAYRSQEQPIFVRMMDKHSVWGYENGLQTMIPSVLLMGLLGYPFNLPDMIGGNGYPNGTSGLFRTTLPSKELYIRWVELSAYMPSMQFSIAPWQYDHETEMITRKWIKVHEEIVTPLVMKAANEAVEHGYPIIRPLWWHDPHCKTCQYLDSEFLVGDSLLVAPVLEANTTSRKIYLPRGMWRDATSGEELEGPIWLKDYEVPLDHVPSFFLQEEEGDEN